MSAQRCLYVTSGWGVHDDRWVRALQSLGFESTVFSLGRDASTVEELRVLVEQAATSSTPILAGPLTSITRTLEGIDAFLVGLSWGFDLYELEEVNDLSWLTHLDGLIVDSVATAAIAESAGVAPANITILPWGVDLEEFTPNGPTADLTHFGIPTDAEIIFSARAHEALYRVADVVIGFASITNQLPQAHLLIAHTGSLTPELEDLAADLGVSSRVHFIGKVAEADLPGILRASACYVSATSVDGTSVTLLQAMACGVPVVVSDSQGNLGWVENSVTGRTFPVGDTQELGQALLRSISSVTLSSVRSDLIDSALLQVRRDADWCSNIYCLRAVLTPSSPPVG